MNLWNTILDIVFPKNCVACGKSGIDLCATCLSGCPPPERENAKWIFSLYDYRHKSIKKALWLLKYKNKKKLAGIFAEALYGRILEELSDLVVMENFNNAILIPIPLSKKRYRERGYNQAELLCEELIKINNLRHLPADRAMRGGADIKLENNILIKPEDTKHQAHIENRLERLRNIVGSFAIKKESVDKIKNKNIILIDDITTTGATLNEAKKILKQSGARKVIAFTVAH